MAITLPHCSNPKVPAPTVPFNHCMPLQTRFNDIDIFSHINNGAYLAFMDLAKANYMTAITGARIEAGGLDAVIVNINCSFYSPAYFDEPLSIVTAVVSVSERSFKIEQRIFNPETGDVKCIGTTVLAGFDPATARGIPLPESLVAAITAFEGRPLATK